MNRKRKLDLIYRHTHPDYKGKFAGERSILVLREGKGTCSVPLSTLTDEEIERKLPHAVRREQERRRT